MCCRRLSLDARRGCRAVREVAEVITGDLSLGVVIDGGEGGKPSTSRPRPVGYCVTVKPWPLAYDTIDFCHAARPALRSVLSAIALPSVLLKLE